MPKKPESEHKPLDSSWKLVERHGLLIRKQRRQPALSRYKPVLEASDFEKAQKKAEKARRKSGEFSNSVRWVREKCWCDKGQPTLCDLHKGPKNG